MRLGILYDRIRKDEKLIIAAAEKRGIEVELIDANKLVYNLENREYDYDLVLERCINHARALYSLKILNEYGIPTVNSSVTAEICGSKFLTTEALISGGVPTPRVLIAFTPDKALEAIEKIGYPCVLKPAIGSWGTMCSKINDREAAEGIIAHKEILGSYHHSIYYIQKYIRKPGRDIRAFVVGGKIIGALYRTSRHWITHLDKGAILSRCDITPELEKVALDAADAVNGGFVAIDIVESDTGLMAVEVDYTVEFSQYFPVLDENIVDELLDYVVGK